MLGRRRRRRRCCNPDILLPAAVIVDSSMAVAFLLHALELFPGSCGNMEGVFQGPVSIHSAAAVPSIHHPILSPTNKQTPRIPPTHSTPLHPTPLHSTPLHSTPLHPTPLHKATPDVPSCLPFGWTEPNPAPRPPPTNPRRANDLLGAGAGACAMAPRSPARAGRAGRELAQTGLLRLAPRPTLDAQGARVGQLPLVGVHAEPFIFRRGVARAD